MSDSLALTAEQMALVTSTAASLPPRWRDRFRAVVSDRLMLRPNPTNADVTAAVSAAKRAICVGVGPPSMA